MTDRARGFYDDAPHIDDVGRQIAWLRGKVRSTALTEAFLEACGAPEDNPAFTETLLQMDAIGKRLGWSSEVINAAFKAEWAASKTKTTEAYMRLEKRVRGLSYARNTGEIIISAARVILEEADIAVPRDVIVAVCKRIALSTVSGHARRAVR